jgi:MFS transporter, DHA1 family, multidrug resistance protein
LNPDAKTLWRAPRWAFAFLLACLGMLGPFAIDTYLPAFAGIAASINATAAQMQQTLSAYLFGFAVMNLFHGALSDSLGRRPVVLWGLGLFAIASVGCALSQSIGALVFWRAVQGISAGAGTVVSRAVIRDMFAPADAQRMMSQVTLYFAIAPAIAPLIGGYLFVHAGWRSTFWFLAAICVLLWIATHRLLPETLHAEQRQPFNAGNLLRGYVRLGSSARFLVLILASSMPFNGMFLYVLSAPVFLGEHLNLGPEQFFWFFCFTVAGVMGGATVSGRMAGRVAASLQVGWGFAVMLVSAVANVALNLLFEPAAGWAMLPIGAYSLGWAMVVPVVTLLVLDHAPERRGMASSVQWFVGSMANGVVAGVVTPLVMHSTLALAVTTLAMLGAGLLAWLWVRPRS